MKDHFALSAWETGWMTGAFPEVGGTGTEAGWWDT